MSRKPHWDHDEYPTAPRWLGVVLIGGFLFWIAVVLWLL